MITSDQAKRFLRSSEHKNLTRRFIQEARDLAAKGLETAQSFEAVKGIQGRLIAFDYLLSESFEKHILQTIANEETHGTK